MTSREEVWSRVYEIALALQYFHERGLVCGDQLSVESVFCSELEGKALMFGADLTQLNEDNCDSDRSSSYASVMSQQQNLNQVTDLGRLCVLIVNCLRAFTMSKTSTPTHFRSKRGESKEGSMRYSSMPSDRPDFIHEDEWQVLTSLQVVNTNSNSTVLMLHAIERLREVAGIDDERDGVDNSAVCRFGDEGVSSGIVSVTICVLGECSVTTALERCLAMISDDTSVKGIYTRLHDVYEQIKMMGVDSAIEATQSKELIESFVSLVVRFHRHLSHLDQSTSSYASVQWSMASVQQQNRDQTTVISLHVSIDRLMSRYNLSSSNKVHTWESVSPMSSISKLNSRSVLMSQLHNGRASIADTNSVDDSSSTASLMLESVSDFVNVANEFEQQPILSKWFISPTEIEFKSFDEFSRGAFGSVHHGKWFNTPVVVKNVLLNTSNRDEMYAQFLQEADTWFELNHINVIKMYGACHIDQPFFVCEYASGGDLSSYLGGGTKRKGDMYEVWYCLLNAALGLQYLHDKGIVHADLKANNVLVGSDGIAKLADFGLSKSNRSNVSSVNDGGARGAYRWKAPECLPWKGECGESATFASDVYSFGMLMIEVVTGVVPWGGMDDMAVVYEVKRGRFPPKPVEIGDSEWHLIERMCCLNPSERVTIDAVVVHLTSLLERIDMGRLWSPVDGQVVREQYINHVVSRGGTLLGLLKFMNGSNRRIARFARNHLVSVQMKRPSRSERREIEAVVNLLSRGSNEEKEWAALALSDMAFQSEANRAVIALCGGIDPLVALVKDGNDEQKENAASALWNLASNDANAVEIASCGGIDLLVALVRDGNDEQKENASGALWNLSTNDDNAVEIGKCGGIAPLVALVKDGNDKQKGNAASALASLARINGNQVEITSCGGIDPLVTLLKVGNDIQKTNAIAALGVLALNNESNSAKIASCEVIDLLMDMIRSTNDKQIEFAVGAMINLAQSDDFQNEIANRGGIEELVALARNGNSKQRTNAAGALWNLTVNDDLKCMIAMCHGIEVLVVLVRDGNDLQKERAAAALWNLATNNENKVEIASHGGIDPLVALVRDGNDDQKERASGALSNLAINDDNRVEIAKCGGIGPLVTLVRDGNGEQKEKASGALWNLAYQNSSRATAIRECGAIQPLLSLLENGSEPQKLNAAGVLGFLNPDAAIKKMIAQHGGIQSLLKYIQDSDNDTNDTEEGLVALQNLCNIGDSGDKNSDDAVYESFVAGGGVDILSQLVENGSERIQQLASSILSTLKE